MAKFILRPCNSNPKARKNLCWYFDFYASNGQLLFTGKKYMSFALAKQAITVVKNLSATAAVSTETVGIEDEAGGNVEVE
jgi:uncharacterized protein YegP (UPF0339 family)